MPISTVQKAHDALLALKPDGASHEGCPLCGERRDAEQEVAHVAESTTPALPGNVYSEAQHFSLVKSAIEQETAALNTEKAELAGRIETLESEKAAVATELSDAKSRIDVLESDKATAEAAAETANTELANFKADIQHQADVAEKMSSRSERVKAANENLGEAYFTDERITRWAEMSDEAFEGLVTEMTEFAAAAKPAAKDEDDDADEDDKDAFAKNKFAKKTSTKEKARESAAFTGGTTPTTSTEGSTLGTLLGIRRGAVA